LHFACPLRFPIPAPFARFTPHLAHVLLLLLGLNLLNYIDRYILPGEPLIQREFHSTDQQMGALTTAMFFFYMFAAPLTGWLGDRFRRKPLIIGRRGALEPGHARHHLGSQLLDAVHAPGAGGRRRGHLRHLCAPAVLADFYPERERNRVLSIFYLAIPVGAALGYLAGGELGSLWGWRAPFFVCAHSRPGHRRALWLAGAASRSGAIDHLQATTDPQARFSDSFRIPHF
jgi:MFS transporter, Spinster family, sphingosine-1-phosphate transporter